MKRIAIITMLLLFSFNLYAQSKKERQVHTAVSALIKAMEDSDVAALSKLAANELSYGHSGGKVENKQEFLNAFQTGASDFVKISISDQNVSIVNKTAIVRHTLEAETNDNNQAGHVKLKVLTVWQKMNGGWKLIARQAVKPPAN